MKRAPAGKSIKWIPHALRENFTYFEIACRFKTAFTLFLRLRANETLMKGTFKSSKIIQFSLFASICVV